MAKYSFSLQPFKKTHTIVFQAKTPKKKKTFPSPTKKKKNKTVCGEKKDAGRSENLEKGSNSAIYNPRIAYLATIVFQKRHDYSSSLQPGSCINPP